MERPVQGLHQHQNLGAKPTAQRKAMNAKAVIPSACSPKAQGIATRGFYQRSTDKQAPRMGKKIRRTECGLVDRPEGMSEQRNMAEAGPGNGVSNRT